MVIEFLKHSLLGIGAYRCGSYLCQYHSDFPVQMNYLGILFHCRFCFPGSGVGPETSISQTSQVMLVLLVHGLGAASIMLPCTIHVSLLCCSVAKLWDRTPGSYSPALDSGLPASWLTERNPDG